MLKRWGEHRELRLGRPLRLPLGYPDSAANPITSFGVYVPPAL